MSSPIYQRLKKNLKHRSKWSRKNNFEAYRLYERDIPEFPYIIDIYKDDCIIYFRGNEKIDGDKNHTPLVMEAIKELLSINEENIFYQNRKVQGQDFQYSTDKEGKKFIVNEGNLKFHVEIGKYIDTGLFLDHRPLRQDLINHEGEKALNLFCYTGSLSVALAQKFKSVTSVDMSNTYLNWAKENFELNKINPSDHHFIRSDVFEFLKNCKNKFDVIVLDPPTFSKSKKMTGTFDVQRDHVKLVSLCAKLLNKDGILYFSNNLRDFKLDQTVLDSFFVKDKTFWSIPDDFRDQKIHKLYKIKNK